MNAPRIDAVLALRGAGFSSVGRDRIAMLEAVDREGSITAAAKALGYSYKGVWNAIAAINNLLPRPAVTAQIGGTTGGGAIVTAEGRKLIRAFHALETRLNRLAAMLSEIEDDEAAALLWGMTMKTSARNMLRGQVTRVTRAPVNVEVEIAVTDAITLVAVITNDAVDELKLAPGRDVIALVKSSFVALAAGPDAPAISTRNKIPGTVASRHDGGVNCEISIAIGNGKTLNAVITRSSADDLKLAAGAQVHALFEASNVILAVAEGDWE